ncbi:MAG: type II toxin-antitoxin system HicB family antitoxin [Dehalococcoidia bacterium]
MKNIEKSVEYYERLPYHIILEQWDDGGGVYWVARVAELPHCLIHADTPIEAVTEIQEVKRDWIKSNLERGLRIPEPVSRNHSGRISLRIPSSLHRMLFNHATIQDISLNQFMTMALAQSVGLEFKELKATTNRRTISSSRKKFRDDVLVQAASRKI